MTPRIAARAPYNFVSLPKEILNAERPELCKSHDRFVSDTLSGWINLTIKPLTPVFIRGPARLQENGHWDDGKDAVRLRTEHYAHPNGTPVIPGSSLRGMIRTLVEILTFSKIHPVTDEMPIAPLIKNVGLDVAEAIFGRLGREDSADAVRGRVIFEDAVARLAGTGSNADLSQPDEQSSSPVSWYEKEFVPEVLLGPKITSYQHYLKQPKGVATLKLDLRTYDGSNAIRGHKLYWHRWDNSKGIEQVKDVTVEPGDVRGQPDTYQVRTILTPVRPVKSIEPTGNPSDQDIEFVGCVRFYNLTKSELGALLTALDLPVTCAHKIGMGKPLGLGSVRTDCILNLINRKERYDTWDSLGAKQEKTETYKDEFQKLILGHEKKDLSAKGQSIPRHKALFKMLEWKGRPAREQTRYMKIKAPPMSPYARVGRNEYFERFVLPRPGEVHPNAPS